MLLNWKDFITTILALLMVGFAYLVVTGYKFPLFSGYRWATLILLILGIGICALSSATPGARDIYTIVTSGLGIAALILVVAGFIFANKTIFLLTVAVIILLWVVATFRHLIGG